MKVIQLFLSFLRFAVIVLLKHEFAESDISRDEFEVKGHVSSPRITKMPIDMMATFMQRNHLQEMTIRYCCILDWD